MGNKLEQAAIEARSKLIPKNYYNNADVNNNYNATHTRALSDESTPINGKGTGIYLDTNNGGGSLDIYGVPSQPGSGRIAAIANNGSKWGYTPQNHYKAPDTSGNIGQVSF